MLKFIFAFLPTEIKSLSNEFVIKLKRLRNRAIFMNENTPAGLD